MASCYRCGRPWPGVSRRALRRLLVRAAILLVLAAGVYLAVA